MLDALNVASQPFYQTLVVPTNPLLTQMKLLLWSQFPEHQCAMVSNKEEAKHEQNKVSQSYCDSISKHFANCLLTLMRIPAND